MIGAFTSQWHPHPDVWLVLAALGGGYVWALRVLGPRHVEPGDHPTSRNQPLVFGLGLLTLLVAADWPMHDLAEESLYSAHMVQHLLMSLVAPPLLIMGIPAWLVRSLLRPRLLMSAMRTLTRPVPAFLIFNGVLVLTHWPYVVELTVHVEVAHLVAHVALVTSAVLMWWPVLSPVAELPRLPYPGQMLYLFLQSVIPTVPASFLTFGSEPLYKVYIPFDRLWGISAIDDQRLAGLIMKLAGGAILWTVIAILFFRWYGAERTGRPDELEWQRLERELNEAKLSRQ